MSQVDVKQETFIAVLKSLLAGGVAGMCSKTTVAPLDRIKILLQAHNKFYENLGVLSSFRRIIKNESWLALYKGNGAQMVRIFPYAATQFTAFEFYRKTLTSALGENSHIAKFLAGSGAGVTAVALTYPLDTIRARLAFQVSGQHVYTGIVDAAVLIFRQEGGISALYRGFTPTICGMIPYAGLSFYCFGTLKYLCMKYLSHFTCTPCSKNTGGLVLILPAKLLCGGLAGAVAQSVSYPLDVTRRRMQLALMPKTEAQRFGTGMLQTLMLIYKEDGVVKGLYRGMSINYLRAIPMTAVSFSTYEIMGQLLGLDTGMKL
ncbi:solute carrier family 25 member 16-like [Hetaerina americana]|uniref:solute carrier family 25 member 16-like n=1 Tax=Hetaerina americana TaxID=62018 RepID=UPI003A7F5383